MRILEWFRFGKRIDELRVNLDRHMHDNESYRERIDKLIKRCEELGEIEHIAAEMAEALEAIRTRERARGFSCDGSCMDCFGKNGCSGGIADAALRKREKREEGQS